MSAINDIAQTVANHPANPAYPDTKPSAWVVGGFVRDLLLGLQPKDADIEVFGVSPEDLTKIVTDLFGDHVDAVGESFGVLKVFLGDGFEIDVALPRRESKAGRGHKGFLIDSDPGLSPIDAGKRRDFTVNAISFNPVSGELFDPFDGVKDLEAKILRVVDATHFVEDPLRVYRAIQFSARFHLTPDVHSFALMKNMVAEGALEELSVERVTDEIRKLLLKAPQPSVGFNLARELGVVAKYYPELEVLKHTPQEPEWHPEGDVWIHTMMVIDAAATIIRRDAHLFTDEERLWVMLGALCHDLGKPATTAPGEKHGVPRLRSLGHEAAGKEPAMALISKWAFGSAAEQAAIAIATQHMLPFDHWKRFEEHSITKDQYINAIRKLIRRIYPTPWRVYLAATEADRRGRLFPNVDTEPYEPGILFSETVERYGLEEQAKTTLIQGRDIMTMAKSLGVSIKPGKRFGEIIEKIEAMRDQGIIKTKEEGLEKLKEILK